MIAAALSLSACGGGKKAAQPTAAPAAPAQNSYAGSPGGMEGAAPAMMPPTLHCGSQPVVWANTKRHVYHMASDPYYGRTKSGQYMCMRDAENAGYHAAGSRHHHRMTTAPGAMAQPSPSPGE